MSARPAIRAATPADLPAIVEVLTANGERADLGDTQDHAYLRHLLGRGRVVVAETADPQSRVVGFGAAIDLGGAAMVTDLFVRPDSHGAGVGTTLLDAVLGDRRPRMTFSSADPRALPVYVRAGMQPWWPNLYLRVPRAAFDRLPNDARLTPEPATLDASAAAALALSGIDRGPDFGHYAVAPGAEGWIVLDGAAVAAVLWSRSDGGGRSVAHATLARDADPLPTVTAVLRAAVRDGPWVRTCVPGPHPALAVLLETGARIEDRDTFCTSDPGWLDPARILPNPGLL